MVKALSLVGLVLNMAGAVCLWWIVPRGSTMHVGRPSPVPFRPAAKLADRWGWPLLTTGFALQFLSILLAP